MTFEQYETKKYRRMLTITEEDMHIAWAEDRKALIEERDKIKREWDEWVLKNKGWIVERAKILTERDEAKNNTYCAYCGEGFPINDDRTPEKVSIHIKTCEKHPMRATEAERERYKAALGKMAQTARDLENEVAGEWGKEPNYEYIDAIVKEAEG